MHDVLGHLSPIWTKNLNSPEDNNVDVCEYMKDFR